VSKGREWTSVNRPEESVSIVFKSVCAVFTPSADSAIDEYYSHTQSLIARSLLDAVKDDEVLTRLLVLELTSSTEAYFRKVLVSLVSFCPLCRRSASLKVLSFGSVDYYDPSALGYALLEGMSLSSAKEVQSQTLNLTGVQITPQSSVGVALAGFGKVCQLRHAIVHSRGLLGSQNVAELGVDIGRPCTVTVDVLSFQALVALCHSAVRAYNRFLYEKVIERWIAERLIKGTWEADKPYFVPLYSLFYSGSDGLLKKSAYGAYRGLKPYVLLRQK
jgi:hypothetical protein